MHIALNTANVGYDGARSYALRLANFLPRMYPDVQYTLFGDPDLLKEVSPQSSNINLVECSNACQTSWVRAVWEQTVLPREIWTRHIDLLYTFSAVDVIAAPCPTIIRIGNMAPHCNLAVRLERNPKKKARLLYLRWASRLSARTADCTLVMSEAAAKELVTKHGFPADKTIGIDRGVDIKSLKSERKSTLDLPGRFILSVSHLHRYKMIPELIEGYYQACQRSSSVPPLLIAGAESDAYYVSEIKNQITSLGLRDKVVLMGNVPRHDLYPLIERAEITVFSSIVETYPVTLLEQMLAGSALVVSNWGVMPAFCGDSVLYYDPTSPQQLCEKLLRLLHSPQLREDLRHSSQRRSTEVQTSWEVAIRRRQELFESVVNRKR